MRPGEIYLAQFPFGDIPGMKIPPVLLFTGPVGSVPGVLVAYISSVAPARLLPSDIVLDPATAELKNTHLKTLSVLRLHKLATIHCSSLARRLGEIGDATHGKAAENLRTLLGLGKCWPKRQLAAAFRALHPANNRLARPRIDAYPSRTAEAVREGTV